MAGELSIKSNKDAYTDYSPQPGMTKNGTFPEANKQYNVPKLGGSNAQNLQDIANEQTNSADSFYNQLPHYTQDQANLSSEGAFQQQAANQRGINQNYSKRGLLYSGLNAGDQAGNQANTANSLAQQIAQQNMGAMQNYQDMSGQGMGSQAGVYNLQISNQWLAYQQALADAQRKQQSSQAMLGAVGGLLGAGLGAL